MEKLPNQSSVDRTPEGIESELKSIYQEDYVKVLSSILDKKFTTNGGKSLFSFKNKHFDNLNELVTYLFENVGRDSKQIVKSIIENMSRMPAGQSMSPRHAAETGQMYCSVSADIFQLLMEKLKTKFGEKIKTEYVNPVDHAANIVTFHSIDGNKIFYADPRNGIFEDLTDNIIMEDRGNIRIYRSKNGGAFNNNVLFSILPSITDSAKAMLHTDMGNFKGMVDFARGNFGDDSKRMGMELAHKLQVAARKYLSELGILGNTYAEDAFTKKYAERENLLGGEMNEFKKTKEFNAEERRVSVERVMSDEWVKIPDSVRRILLVGDQFQAFLLNGDKNKITEIIGLNDNFQVILKSLESIREAFGIRWLVSNIINDNEKIYDLKPYFYRAKSILKK